MKRISDDAWHAAQLALMRYKENKNLINHRIDVATSKDPQKKGSGSKPLTSDPTAAAAMKLEHDAVYQRAKREVAAVESVIESMDPVKRKVIDLRFFRHAPGIRTPVLFRYINSGYSERQMRRIVREAVRMIAEKLGEE